MINLAAIKTMAVQTPDHAALVTEDHIISWNELQKQVELRISLVLSHCQRNLPIQVCYISENRAELIYWLAAFTTLGIPATGLDYTLSTEALKELIRAIKADLILVSDRILSTYEVLDSELFPTLLLSSDQEARERRQNTHPDLSRDIQQYLSGSARPEKPYRSVGVTSGTTGLPKLVLRDRSFDQRRFAYFTLRYGFTKEDRFLISMPLYHAAGNGWARMLMGLGATLYLARTDQPSELAHAIAQHEITATVMTPTTLKLMLDLPGSELVLSKHRLRWVLIGGKYFPAQLKKQALNRLGPVLFEYYGTTETGVNTIAEPTDLQSHPHSVGRSFEGNDIAIVDGHGSRLGTGEIGIVAVASYMNMTNYSDNSARKVVLEGKAFLHTSEQGYMDGDGRLYLLNRSSGRKNHHYVYRLENAIRELACISDVALLQREDHDSSLVDCAVTVSQTTENPFLYENISMLARAERLQLSRYRVVPHIPYSPSGKVRVRDLELLLAG